MEARITPLTLSEIWIYPIKSLAGISLTETELTSRGLKYDRRWMLIDANGKFMTQRSLPDLALIDVKIEGESLLVSHRQKNLLPLLIPFKNDSSEPLTVQVWDDTMEALSVSAEADRWFSEALDQPCRLVFQPESTQRKVDSRYASHGEITSFSDGYPFLLIGQESLNDLNARLESPVPMNRFRPNLVFTGGNPYEEDTWAAFKVGPQDFFGVKPCARCVLTTIDQTTAEKGKEPLKTLSKYRSWNNKILFGQNLLPGSITQSIKVGDLIEVSKVKEAPLQVEV
ncbi:MOSC domain-containing protein [Siphonobacter sp. SORGH_AS_0500]|uniref:MOSC domain-containing protein n=1 Tax=Siphonobacter sp. SORGH_AS_0500 TaxID=1864824 RepID=UPI000CBBA619|nr:MOSC N-terminal beta barrel domain-containing protein [Siphonobacter sp. SORGH_AS_0500]PKK37818.1 MOSC domain-containing protein [Siphonobacter sp. SORGH_AS_0500]